MKKLSSKSLNTVRYLMFTFIILLILLGLYRFSYIPGREDYFTSRNLRMLSEMSQQLTTILASYKGQIDKNLVNTKTSLLELEDIEKQVERIRHLTYIDKTIDITGIQLFNDQKKSFQDTQNIQDIPEQTIDTDDIEFSFASIIKYQLTLQDSGHVILIDYLGKRVEKNKKGGTYSIRLKASVSVSDIMEDFLKPDIFENILIVENTRNSNKNGQVIYQAERQAFLATRLDSLTEGLKETWSSYHDEVNWGNTDYRLYVQPVRAALLGENKGSETHIKDWMLIGLVDAKNFNTEARAISRFQLSQWAFVFFVFLFSLPLFKLYFIGPREELKRQDLLLGVFSFFVLTGLLAFWLLSFYSDQKDINDLDGGLRPLSEKIENNLYAEIEDIIDQAKTITQHENRDTNAPKRPLTPRVLSEETSVFQEEKIKNFSYPYFRQFSWIDSTSGVQTRKISTRKVITPLVKVAHREYFKKIRDNQAWELNGRSFYIEPIISITTGENVAAVSMPNESADSIGLVNMMETELLSLMNVTFPKGSGFCVIDESGEVLFHSSPQKNMQENFFVECNNPPALQASIASRVSNHLSVNYEGREHRLFARPFKHIPTWSLITFSGPSFWYWYLALSVLIIFSFLPLLYFTYQVFGIALILPARPWRGHKPIETIYQNTLFIGYPNSGKSQSIRHLKQTKIIDLRKLSSPDELTQAIEVERNQADFQLLVLDHFDLYWQDEQWNLPLLQLMEELISKKNKTMVLVTTIDPTVIYTQPNPPKGQQTSPAGSSDQGLHNWNRWKMLLSTFTKIYHHFYSADDIWVQEVKKEYLKDERTAKRSNQLLERLLAECRHTPFLQKVGLEILDRYEDLGSVFVNEDALIDEILLRSEVYYQSVWALCSIDEKITLIHLARNHFVPFKDARVVRLLMRKGLVSAQNYRLLNQSFSKFTQTAEPSTRIKEWKKDQERSWESIRTPLFTFIFAVLAFTFVTQRDIFNTSIAWITTVGALIPTILRILTFLEPRRRIEAVEVS